MLEIEIKTRSVDNGKIEHTLLERGATLSKDCDQVD